LQQNGTVLDRCQTADDAGDMQVFLQCVAVCCSVFQCVAVCCSVLQCVAVCCRVFQCVAECCGWCWRHAGLFHFVYCIVLRCVAVFCSVL